MLLRDFGANMIAVKVRRRVSTLLRRSADRLLRLAAALCTDPAETRVRDWYAAKGDTNLRLDYDLSERSLVFDLGGYEGQWASDIFAMYRCEVYVFEPVPEFAEKITPRFRHNSRINVFKFGLSCRNETARIGLAKDASSTYLATKESPEIPLVSVSEFLRDHGIGTIDLMKINIEGGEYDLLEHLIDAGLITRIRNIQVQFHDFVPSASTRMAAIQRDLAATHDPTYQFPFVWENWRIRA